MLGKAPLRALSEMQLRSSVYRRVISILRNVPPLRLFDWSQHPPWNVLIIVLPSHWGAGSMGRALLGTRSSLCFRCLLFFPLWRGPGGGRRRVDLNVFGSPVLWPRVGSCRCWGGPFFLALRVDWCPSWSPPSASSTHRGLGGAGPSALPESHRLEWIAATFRPRGHGGAGLLEVAALTFSALAPRRRH